MRPRRLSSRCIEQAVDAYVKAFEETGKEIMRPSGSRFDPAGNTMWPVKSWAACWGPALLQMLADDGLPLGPKPYEETFAAMLQFTPLRNAFNLSKLALMTGNHQWMDTAPRLPRGNLSPAKTPIYATQEYCRHYGYPFNEPYTLPTDVEIREGGNLKKDLCEADADDFSRAKKYPAKIGFRFWQDTDLRRKVFNCVFKGPLSRGVCNTMPGQALGGEGDPYPAAYPESDEGESPWQYEADCGVVGMQRAATKGSKNARKPLQPRPAQLKTARPRAAPDLR